MERLDKILSATGRWSRREARELVRQGRVSVDGHLAVTAEEKIDSAACILVDGEMLAHEKYIYVMLHKPAGVLSATEDSRQPTVLDLLPPDWRRRGIAPVGRLDKDTEGLLLLTDDGALSHRLTSPRYHVDKVYYARVSGTLTMADAEAFAAGMILTDGLKCLPAELKILSPGECLVTLQEGKFHQVKRMLAHRGKPVTYLKRLSMGDLRLDETLAPGAYRLLTPEELTLISHSTPSKL
ncbi:MAG: 16S rRNA pseudouridine(516) synthase [Oscillospiraceae bacterium]|nr:16S rRNA pseudouridine(516) synthase [Oscillospiraceae bacterium]